MSRVTNYILFFLLASQPAFSQHAFEVASVKPAADSSEPNLKSLKTGWTGGPGTNSPGRMTASGVSLKSMLVLAYGVKSYQISGPASLDSTMFDIMAKVPADATKEQVPLMLQDLLAERFKLAIHQETRELPVYALVVAKGGPKMKEAQPDDPAAPAGQGPMPKTTIGKDGFPEFPPGYHRNTSVTRAQGMKIWSKNRTMEELAGILLPQADRPIVDMTGLKGHYEFTLTFRFENGTGARDENAGSNPKVTDFSADTLFTAIQKQLGLKFDPRKAPVEMLVVDHVELKPTDN